MIGLRFRGDRAVPEARFETYRRTFGDRFEAIELDPKDAQPGTGMTPHSVLTIHLRDDDPGGPTKRAEARVIQFFRERLGVTRCALAARCLDPRPLLGLSRSASVREI